MKASVIIPTYNEETNLPLLLDDLKRQKTGDFEVIVADADSKDRTREIARSRGARVVDGGLPAAGRNAGAAVASGDILVFFDSDIRVPPTFLGQALSEMEKRNLVAATAEARPLSDLLMDRLIHRSANLFVRLNQERDPHAPGYCILVRRDVFTKIGGFNEAIKVAEDHDLVRRAAAHGPFRMLHSAWFRVSVRRYEKEGRIAYSLKAAQVTVYRALHGEITDDSVVEYEFGNFEAEDRTTAQKALRQVEKGINRLDRQAQKAERKLEKALKKGRTPGKRHRVFWNRLSDNFRELGEALFGEDQKQ
jgi:glycosyltransferase involved in cell wall biosynthesis